MKENKEDAKFYWFYCRDFFAKQSCPFCGTKGLHVDYTTFGTEIRCLDGCHSEVNSPCAPFEFKKMWKRQLKKSNMKTFNQAILDIFEITEEDASLSVKDNVLMEDSSAECHKSRNRFIIRNLDKEIYGKGKSEEEAWTNAALFLQGFEIRKQ